MNFLLHFSHVLSIHFQAQLREHLRSLSAQFDEAQQSWKQFERRQLDSLKTLLPYSTTNSLEEIIEEVISHVNHLTEEINSLKEQDFEAIRHQSQPSSTEKANG